MNKDIALFIASCRTVEWYGKYHGNTIDLSKEIIRLPITKNGKPDFEYMDKYIKSVNIEEI